MIVYRDYVSFTVLGEEINLISSETSYGLSTIAEVKGRYHYMGGEQPTIATAVYTWQELNSRDLTDVELRQVMIDNNLISSAI